MSSTEEGKDRPLLESYFDEVLAPLAERMRASGRQAFPLGPDAACSTYYVTRPQPAMTREMFTAPACEDAADFQNRLAAHWQALGRTELLESVNRTGALAQAARDAREHLQASTHLSPDLYVMF